MTNTPNVLARWRASTNPTALWDEIESTAQTAWSNRPWTRTNDLSQVVPNVWVSGDTAAQALYRRPGWTVIDVREGLHTTPPAVIRIPLKRAATQWRVGRKALCEVADAVDAGLARGDQVLVHCWMGKERSPLALVGWLCLSRAYSLDEAYNTLKRTRGAWDRRNWLTRKAWKALTRVDDWAAA